MRPLTTPSCLCLLALTLPACTDHFLSDTDRLGLASADTSTADALSDTADADPDATPLNQRYPFVRILDTSVEVAGMNPGTDLDAVSVTKPSGDIYWAAKVEAYDPTEPSWLPAETMIVENILGEPQAFGSPFNPANVGPDQECSLDGWNFLGLGGPGGSVVLSFGPERYVESGDLISVYEIGGCSNSISGPGIVDTFNVQVALASAPDAEWVTLFAYEGSDIGPLIRVPVP